MGFSRHAYEGIDFKPPQAVADAAAKGLELRRKQTGDKAGLTPEEAGEQGIGSGVQRAVNLKNRDTLSPETIRMMNGFFARHEKNKSISEENKDTPWKDNGYVSWLLWGGDPGKKWVEKIISEMEEQDAKKTAAGMDGFDFFDSFGDEEVELSPEAQAIQDFESQAGGMSQIMSLTDDLLRDRKLISMAGGKLQYIQPHKAWFVYLDVPASQAKRMGARLFRNLVGRRNVPTHLPALHQVPLWVGTSDGQAVRVDPPSKRASDRMMSLLVALDRPSLREPVLDTLGIRTAKATPKTEDKHKGKKKRNIPDDVRRYVKETEEGMPGKDPSYYWAVAWSRYCVAGDTYVNTSMGMMTVAEVAKRAVGRQVVHADGVVSREITTGIASHNGVGHTSHVINTGTKPVVKVKTKHGYTLTCTPDHQVLALNTENYSTEWVEAGDCEGRYLIIPTHGLHGQQTTLPDLGYQKNVWNNVVPLRPPKEMTRDLARVLGYLVAEGSVTEEGIEFSNTDPRVLADYTRCMARLFGEEPTVVWGEPNPAQRKMRRFAKVRSRTRWYKEFFASLGLRPGTARDKEIPHVILQAPRRFVVEFFRGFVEGDGFTGDEDHLNRVDLSTSSSKLAHQLHLMLARLGIPATLEKDQQGYFTVRVHSEPLARKFATVIGGGVFKKVALTTHRQRLRGSEFECVPADGLLNLHKSIANKFPGSRRVSLSRIQRHWDVLETHAGGHPVLGNLRDLMDSGYLFDPASVEDAGQAEVFDLTVPGDASFVANGLIAHNCKYKNPGSDHCKMDTGDYFPGLGKKAKESPVNWCDMNPQCRGNFGIARKDMPQIRDVPAFVQWLQGQGIRVRGNKTAAEDLKPVQNYIATRIVQKLVDKNVSLLKERPLVRSADSYILDGHHRWAAVYTIDPSTPLPTITVGVPIRELLRLAEEFPGVAYSEKVAMSDRKLFNATVRLAHEHPNLRPHLLPLLKKAANDDYYLGDEEVGVYWGVKQKGSGWFVDAWVDGDTFTHDYPEDGPYDTERDAVEAGWMTAKDWCMDNDVDMSGSEFRTFEQWMRTNRVRLAKEEIPGGLAKGKKPSDFDQKELAMGIEVEKEHLVNDGYSPEELKAKAQEIAMDHLVEIEDYYTRLKGMEAEAEGKKASRVLAKLEAHKGYGKRAEQSEQTKCMEKFKDPDGTFKGPNDGTAWDNCIKAFTECRPDVDDPEAMCGYIKSRKTAAAKSARDAATIAFREARKRGKSASFALEAAEGAMAFWKAQRGQ